MTYNESLEYIKKLALRGSKPGLERISGLLSSLGNPQKKLRCIHVSGTNGKGSVCAMLASILKRAGYNVGVFTSPALERVNEMFVYNGREISDLDFALLTKKLMPECERAEATEYEFYTAAAYYYFSLLNTDIVIIECCMGGLLDATNVIDSPILSVITGIAKDHTAFLGPKLSDIAFHKAGIIKENCPVVVNCKDQAAYEVIASVAKRKGADCVRVSDVPRLIDMSIDGIRFDCGLMKRVCLFLAGEYQMTNAITVLYCIDILKKQGLRIGEDNIRQGLANAFWKGRFEVLSRDPLVIFDGCHNMQGCESVEKTVEAVFGEKKLIFVTGVMKDKDYSKMAEIMRPHASCVFTVTPNNKRALDAQSLADVYKKLGAKCVTSCDDIKSAVAGAFDAAKKSREAIFIFGSLYMYGEIKAEIQKFVLKSGE